MTEASLNICESIHGTWHYHLRRGASLKALCGKPVMHTSMPFDRWNKPIPDHHIPESFCKECDELKGKADG